MNIYQIAHLMALCNHYFQLSLQNQEAIIHNSPQFLTEDGAVSNMVSALWQWINRLTPYSVMSSFSLFFFSTPVITMFWGWLETVFKHLAWLITAVLQWDGTENRFQSLETKKKLWYHKNLILLIKAMTNEKIVCSILAVQYSE